MGRSSNSTQRQTQLFKDAGDVSLLLRVAAARPPPHTQCPRMRLSSALFILLASAEILTPGCAVKENSTREAIQSIINMAGIALVHIRTLRANLVLPADMEVSSPSVEGVGSLGRDLGLLGNKLLLLPFGDLLAQIEADLSSLEGRVRVLALPMGCSLPARPPVESQDHNFPHSNLHLTLAKVQDYLEKIPPNKDKLKVC